MWSPLALACAVIAQEPLFPGELYPPAGARAIADLNGDGLQDVVCASNGFTVSVAFGLPGGGFGAPLTISTPLETHSRAAIGDLNLDGNLDLVTSAIGLATFLGDGAGSFTVGPTADGDWTTTSLETADVDLDGDPDFVTNSLGADFLLLYLSRGDGTFDPFIGIGTSGFGVDAVAIGDVHGDGLLDLVAVADSPNRIFVVPALLPGFFGETVSLPLQGLPNDLALGDLNGDGRDDAVVTTDSIDQLEVLLADGAGGFGASVGLSNPSSDAVVALGDLDSDGRLDLVASGTSGISRRLGDGAGGFGAALVDPDLGSGGAWLAIASVSGDAHPDIVASASGTGFVPGDGAGGLVLIPAVGGAGTLLDVACGDLDGDGDTDFVAARLSSPSTFAAAMGDGAGGVGPFAIYPDPVNTQSLAVGDYDHDGILDVLGGAIGGSVAVMRGLPGGGFGPAIVTSVFHKVHGFAQADLDRDGNLDIVAFDHGGPDGIAVLLGNGAAGFGRSTFFPEIAPSRVDCADIDLDGRVDVAVARSGGNASVRFGTGGGSLGPTLEVAMGGPQTTIRVADLDGDSLPDLVAGLAKSVSVVRARGVAGAFGAPIAAASFTSSNEISDMALGGVTGGSLPDIVFTRRESSQLIVLPPAGGGAFGPMRTFAAPVQPRALAIADFDGNGAADVVLCTDSVPGDIAGRVSLLHNLRSSPAGTALYGTGTPGCLGVLGLAANQPAHVGSDDFAFLCTNAPPNALGLGLQSDVADVAGSDPFGLGVALHVSLFGTPNVKGFDFESDAGGIGFAEVPIASDPGLSGATLFVQAIWLEAPAQSCSPSPFHLISSKGLSYAIAP